MARRSLVQRRRRRLAAGLGLAGSLGLLQLAVHERRSPRFAAALPILPEDYRVVLIAESGAATPDGDDWAALEAPAVAHADTPELVYLGERLLLYSLSADGERIQVKEADRPGPGRPIDLGGACQEPHTCVDPALLTTDHPSPGLRLFVVQAPTGVDPALSDQTRVLSAHSTDGQHFRLDPAPALALPARVDPDPVRLPDGRLRLYTTHLRRDGARPRLEIESAVGTEGLPLETEPGVRMPGASATRSVATENGVVTYFHDLSGQLRRARSADGLAFAVEPGPVPVALPPGHRYLGLEAPSLVRGPRGWRMAVSTVVEPWWPWSELVVRHVEREVEWAP